MESVVVALGTAKPMTTARKFRLKSKRVTRVLVSKYGGT